jgi:hypothetical protein
MSINATWHKKHPMGMGTTLDQRVEWHVAHAKACDCRKEALPPTILKELKRRGENPPTRSDSLVQAYNAAQAPVDELICDLLAHTIDKHLPKAESKIWHRHPVWFLDGNPIVGYSRQKAGMRLMFWSGKDFAEPELNVVGKKFKDASVFYGSPDEVDAKALKRWLKKSVAIQWDYKNIVKRKGRLVRL